jgi:hypothetical protein
MRWLQSAPASLQNLWTLHFPALSQTSTSTSSLNPPQTEPARLHESSNEKASKDTILYLAYGSNLSAETFQGTRGIKPLSATNVHVPSLDLTFDLAGVPYLEPCFSNSRHRTPPSATPSSNGVSNDQHNKDKWRKGLIGVVYEVTREDYRTIIATEGGGASYQDIVVPCYAIPAGQDHITPEPAGVPFGAHTLLAPRGTSNNGRVTRPDPSYAQPSARYLKLIVDGAKEHQLPAEYLSYLHNIRSFTITTHRQATGRILFLSMWAPIILVVMGLGKFLADDEGRVPGWLAKLMVTVFAKCWATYDNFFKRIFGEGERTIGCDDEELGFKDQVQEDNEEAP